MEVYSYRRLTSGKVKKKGIQDCLDAMESRKAVHGMFLYQPIVMDSFENNISYE